MKKILLSLCCLSLPINSAFSMNSDSNIIIVDQSKIDRKNRQIMGAIKSAIKNSSDEIHQELFDLTAPFFRHQEWSVFSLLEIFRYIASIKDHSNFKENILLAHNILENKNKDITPAEYTKTYELISTMNESSLDIVFYCLNNIFLKNIKLEKLIRLIKEEKNAKLENLNKWEKIISFISNRDTSDENYTKFLRFILINGEKGPSENCMAYWDLLFQLDNTESSYSVDPFIVYAINAGELSYECAYPLLKKILEKYPYRNFESRQSVATYILHRAESSMFRDRFNYVCDNFGSQDFDFVHYMNYINHVYDLNENAFDALNTIVCSIKSIYPECIDLPGNKFKKFIDFMLLQTEDKRNSIFENINIQWVEAESKTPRYFIELMDSIIASDVLEKEHLAIIEKERQERLEQEMLALSEKEKLERLERERQERLEKERLDKLEKKRLDRLEKESFNRLDADQLNNLEIELLQKLYNQDNISLKELIDNRRKLININQRRFDFLSFDEQQAFLDDFRAKRLAILMQHPINDEEADCLSELNALDEMFFQQIQLLKSIEDVKKALEDHKQTRLNIHLSVARTDEESALIADDEEKEAELIDDDVMHVTNQIMSQDDENNLIINEEKKEESNLIDEDDFRAYLKTKLSIFILGNLEANNLEKLSREAFLIEFDAKGFDQFFVEHCLAEWDDIKKFECSRGIIVKRQKSRLLNKLKSLIMVDIDLTYEAFLKTLPLDVDLQMTQDIWDEIAEDSRQEEIVWQNLQKLTIQERKENDQKWLEELRAKRLAYYNQLLFQKKK
ncbi:MAG: hypothetical protein Q8L85_02880 [Alphaproteobacteria bacterium]|nr:hypothetical protein [Alphaproteobacteria bacterium]